MGVAQRGSPARRHGVSKAPREAETSPHWDVHAPLGGVDPLSFLGEWADSLGHQVMVVPKETPPALSPKKAKKEKPVNAGCAFDGAQPESAAAEAHAAALMQPWQPRSFHAILSHDTRASKTLLIHFNRKTRQWVCGNGVLDVPSAKEEQIVWKTKDGRASTWRRYVPRPIVYFDAVSAESNAAARQTLEAAADSAPDFVPSSASADSSLEQVVAAEQQRLRADFIRNAMHIEAAACAAEDEAWAVAASEKTQAPVAEKDQAPSPEVSTALAAPSTVQEELRDDGVYVRVKGASSLTSTCFVWTVDEPWEELADMPAQCALGSPFFHVVQGQDRVIGKVQLVFHPCRSRSAQSSSVVFNWEPFEQDNVGIRFQVSLNASRSDPKLCLGPRLECSFPRPARDVDDICISCDVLGVVDV